MCAHENIIDGTKTTVRRSQVFPRRDRSLPIATGICCCGRLVIKLKTYAGLVYVKRGFIRGCFCFPGDEGNNYLGGPPFALDFRPRFILIVIRSGLPQI